MKIVHRKVLISICMLNSKTKYVPTHFASCCKLHGYDSNLRLEERTVGKSFLNNSSLDIRNCCHSHYGAFKYQISMFCQTLDPISTKEANNHGLAMVRYNS